MPPTVHIRQPCARLPVLSTRGRMGVIPLVVLIVLPRAVKLLPVPLISLAIRETRALLTFRTPLPVSPNIPESSESELVIVRSVDMPTTLLRNSPLGAVRERPLVTGISVPSEILDRVLTTAWVVPTLSLHIGTNEVVAYSGSEALVPTSL